MTMNVGDGERGEAILEWALGTTLVVLPLLMAVLAVPVWTERSTMVRTVAHEAALAATAASTAADAQALANSTAAAVAAGYGLAADDVTVILDGSIERGGTVTATASVVMPLIEVPLVGTFGGITVSRSAHAQVDLYRSKP